MNTTDQAIEDLANDIKPAKPANLDRDPLLQTREITHGDFTINATAAQEIKRVFRTRNVGAMPTRQAECLDLIATKIGRILAGDASFRDHWADIAGFAKLAEEACEHG